MFLAALKSAQGKEEQAIKRIMRAACLGDACAQNELGIRYEKGTGIKKDIIEAVEWYKKAADNGDMYAQANIGLAFYHGRGVTQNYKLAIQWYKRAAEQGHKESQYNLGLLYVDDLDNEDIVESIRWLSKAESNGMKEASDALEKIRARQ
jgi:uncharacterized protein